MKGFFKDFYLPYKDANGADVSSTTQAIAPITTIDYSNPPLTSSEFEDVVESDLDRIKAQYLDRGWAV